MLPSTNISIDEAGPFEDTVVGWSGDELRAVFNTEDGRLIGFAAFVPTHIDELVQDSPPAVEGLTDPWLNDQPIPWRSGSDDAAVTAERYLDLGWPDWRSGGLTAVVVAEARSADGSRPASAVVEFRTETSTTVATMRLRYADGQFMVHDVRSSTLQVDVATVSAGLRGTATSTIAGTLVIDVARAKLIETDAGADVGMEVVSSNSVELDAGVVADISTADGMFGHELRAGLYDDTGALLAVVAYQPVSKLDTRQPGAQPGGATSSPRMFLSPISGLAGLEELLATSGLFADWVTRDEWATAAILGIDVERSDPYASLTSVATEVVFKSDVSVERRRAFITELTSDGSISSEVDLPLARPTTLSAAEVAEPIVVAAVPNASRCMAPPGTPIPPNGSGVGPSDLVAPTAEEAAEAFRAHPDSPNVYASMPRTFVNENGETIGFAYGDDWLFSFLLVVTVAPVDGGWTVTGWQSVGC